MSLAHPYWLLALLILPLIVVGAGIVTKRQSGKWNQLVADRLRRQLIRSGSAIPRWLALIFLLAGTALIIMAISRPQGDGGTKAEISMGRDLLLALDLSNSMRVQDVQPDRLELAKIVIYELLEEMPNDRIGLVGFAGEPHLYAPLTIDHSAVRETIEQMDEDWPTMGGSDLGAAIRLGIETLKETGNPNNAMVILTDGEMHDGDIEQMAAEAREAGVYLITIGVGTEDGGTIPNDQFRGNLVVDRNGNPVLSRINTENLMKLAQKTDGSFAMASSGADIPDMVKASISGLEAFEIEGRERKVYIEFYQWLVLPAILLLIACLVAGTRWRALTPVTAAGLAILLISNPEANAQEDDGIPNEAPTAQERQMERFAQLADKTLLESRRARYRLGEATAAYRLKQWDRASNAYSQALRTHSEDVRRAGHHGMGNTLFQKGWLNFFEEAYTAELDSIESMKRFENAARMKLETLKRQKPSEDNEDKAGRGYDEIEQTILDWSDGIRHYQSVLKLDPNHQGAIQNRELSLAYLRKLQELLIEDEERTEQQMPEPQPDPSQGDDGNSENQQPGDQDPDQNGEQGDNPQQSPNGDPNNDGQPGDRDPNAEPNDQPGDRDPNAEDGEPDPDAEIQPGETPEEHARRRLRESSDSEKGPMTPGRIQLRTPEKDW